MSKPLVSVCCLSFNHQKHIRECLDGFIMQKTNFVFEVLIHDDASTDKTAKIIKEYEDKYPDIIKPIYQTQNKYSKGIGVTVTYNFPRATGMYIAMCEGDDYWIDPLKLQRQVDFLENNPDYNFSVSAYNTINDKGKIEIGESFKRKTDNLLIRDYIAKRFSQTSTFVFRNNFELPSWIAEVYASDQAMLLLIAKDKKIKYHREVFSVYRIHSKGIDTIYNNYFERNEKYIFLLKKIKLLTNDWKCRLIIDLKIHIVSIKNYSMDTWFENIIKVYAGFLNKVVVRIINTFLNWI